MPLFETDYDECNPETIHAEDCGKGAKCINQPGTYTCECDTDMDYKGTWPECKRKCLIEICEYIHCLPFIIVVDFFKKYTRHKLKQIIYKEQKMSHRPIRSLPIKVLK